MTAYTDRLSALYKTSVIRHPGLTRGRDEILAIHRASQTESIAGFIIVTGDTGSGKSTLVTEVRDAIMRAAEPDKVPCVYFEIPEQTSRKTLVGALLEAMDDDDPYGPKEAVLLSRLTRTVPEKGVELIIADEMQHLVSENKKVNKKGADLLKHACNRTRRPFVLVGDHSLRTILDSNKMFQRRILGVVDLEPFNLSDKDRLNGIQPFRGFLRLYDARLPFPEWCALDSTDMLVALHTATEGFIGFFVQLVQKAGALALADDARRIEPTHWAQAWRTLRQRFVADKRNPFEGLVLPAPQPKSDAQLRRYKAA